MGTSVVEKIAEQVEKQYLDLINFEKEFENEFTEIAEFYEKAMSEPDANVWWLEHCWDSDIDYLRFDIIDYYNDLYEFVADDDIEELANEWLTINPEATMD